MTHSHYQKISVIIAAYNEESTIEQIVELVKKAAVPTIALEIIVVNDGSTDKTGEILKKIPGILSFEHSKNTGKGSALRTGIEHASGDILILQDADLEYDPSDYSVLIQPILDGRAEIAIGSRFRYYGPKFFTKNGDPFFSHYIGNKMIVWLTNLLYGQEITDYEGCYKAFTRTLSRAIPIQANGFEFDNELVCKSLRKKYRLVEVPIRYNPRLYDQGKKIKWHDGIKILWAIVKWRFWLF